MLIQKDPNQKTLEQELADLLKGVIIELILRMIDMIDKLFRGHGAGCHQPQSLFDSKSLIFDMSIGGIKNGTWNFVVYRHRDHYRLGFQFY